jgi:hypothetical protein
MGLRYRPYPLLSRADAAGHSLSAPWIFSIDPSHGSLRSRVEDEGFTLVRRACAEHLLGNGGHSHPGRESERDDCSENGSEWDCSRCGGGSAASDEEESPTHTAAELLLHPPLLFERIGYLRLKSLSPAVPRSGGCADTLESGWARSDLGRRLPGTLVDGRADPPPVAARATCARRRARAAGCVIPKRQDHLVCIRFDAAQAPCTLPFAATSLCSP